MNAVTVAGGLALVLAEGTDIVERIDPDLMIEELRMLEGRNAARPQIERLLENDW